MSASRIARISSATVGVLLIAGVCVWFFYGAVSSDATSAAQDQSPVGIKSVCSKVATVYTAAGRKNNSAESWIVVPNKLKVETDDIIRVRNGVDHWILNKHNNRYIVIHHPTNPSIQVEKWSKPSDVVDNWRHVEPNLTESRVRKNLDGVERDAVEVDLPNWKDGSQKVDLFPDKATGRTETKITRQFDHRGNLIWTERVDFEYNKEIDDKMFVFSPPANAVEVSDQESLKLPANAYIK
ncbi:MAG: LolA family protein [Armatimonadota bacterium]